MFAALLGIPVDSIFFFAEEVKSLGDELPILGLLLAAVAALLDQLPQEGGLLWTPVIGGEVDLLQAEPFEHAGLARDAGDERGDGFPIFMHLDRAMGTISFSTSVRPRESEYLATVQMSICTSSSLQFFLIRLFLAILRGGEGTFRCGG